MAAQNHPRSPPDAKARCKMQTINVRGEERESYLDAFSLCETFFREEAGQASQLFDDLGRHCPSDLTLCEPLPDVDEMRASAAFLSALGALGVADAATLAAATGASPGDCEGVMANPLRCDAAARARVLQAVEDSPPCAVVRRGRSKRADRWRRACKMDARKLQDPAAVPAAGDGMRTQVLPGRGG